MLSLKPAGTAPPPCKICGTPSPLFGAVDFNTNCRIPNGVTLTPVGKPVRYHRCPNCGFLFTDALDTWSHADYKEHIYNDDYILVDPGYRDERPRSNAKAIVELFGARRAERRVLDFGGGNDTLCTVLREAGFPVAVTYDPFVPEFATRPEGKYDLITCFETLEHMPDPVGGIGALIESLDEPGLVLFSTLVQPADFDRQRLGWWYVGPRNGHISLFSRNSLVHAWRRYGYHVASLNDNLHMAFRTLPDFARERFKVA